MSAALNWNEDNLIDSFCEPIARFAGLSGRERGEVVTSTAERTVLDNPAWRSIPLERQHLTTGLSQSHGFRKEYEGVAFFTASTVDSFTEELSPPFSQASSAESVEQILSQFYQQSYAIHEDTAVSADTGTSVYSNETSSFGSYVESPLTSFTRAKDVPAAGHLTSLKDIPNAIYLNSIHPQTMTVNLIIGIISIPPPRSIKTRRGADVELIEVLVGDETKSGFGINFWLSASSRSVEGDMKSVLSGIRPQDVVLMRNVALSSFRGKVYGQSLMKEMTKVHLLYRTRIDKTDIGGCYNRTDLAAETLHTQVEKTRRVREWVLRFVGTGPRTERNGRAVEAAREVLPPDTQ
jgi:hypothetical protein